MPSRWFNAKAAGTAIRMFIKTAENDTISDIVSAEDVEGVSRKLTYHLKVKPCGNISCQYVLKEKIIGMMIGKTINKTKITNNTSGK